MDDLAPIDDAFLADFLARTAALKEDTPAKRWEEAGHATGRASIIRMLGLEGYAHADYATMPFRVLVAADGSPRIACAIGCPPIYDRDRVLDWTHLDIREVLLWEPRQNRIDVAGDEGCSHLILPDVQDDRLTVFADPRAYLRAWAGRRIRIAEQGSRRARGECLHPVSEGTDGGLPGALIIGEPVQPGWHRVTAKTVVAGAGTDKATLFKAAVASANLPRFEEMAGADVR